MSSITGEIQPGFLNMPKLPVSGLFMRTIAFLIDFLLVLSAIHILRAAVPDLFWALGKWTPYLTGTFTFAYFVFFNSQHGRGRTVGKLLVGIATTDYDGNPPTLRQAVLRTVILFPIFVTMPIMEAVIGPADSTNDIFWKSALAGIPLFAMILATFVSLPFNPFKQGLHDYFSQTLVRPIPRGGEMQPLQTFEEMAERIGHSWPKFHRQPQYSAGVAFGIVFILLLFMISPSKYPDNYRQILEGTFELGRTSGLTGAEISRGFISSQDQGWQLMMEDVAENPEVQSAIASTSGTLTLLITVSYDGKRTVPPDQNLELLLDGYYANLLPLFVAQMLKTESTGAADRLQFERMLAERLTQEPFKFGVLVRTFIPLTPYPNPLNRYERVLIKDYEPIETP